MQSIHARSEFEKKSTLVALTNERSITAELRTKVEQL